MRIGRRGLGWLLFLASWAALFALFDWNWLKPSVERYFSEPSGRSVQIGDLHVSLGEQLEPVVRLRGLRVQNAPWAGTQAPLAVAEEMRFRFAWASLVQRRPLVITEMALVGAELNLLRRANGVRNWRLRRPDDTEDGRVRVETLVAQRSRLRFEHQGFDVVIDTRAEDITSPVEPVKGEALTQRIHFEGNYRGEAFAGRADTGPALSFQQTGRFVPLRGHAVSGGTRLDVEGRVADLFKLTAIDADIRLRGKTLAALDGFIPIAWPRTPPYKLSAHLLKEQREFTLVKLTAEVGRSDLAGEIGYDTAGERARLEATLTSRRADIADLGSLVRAPSGKDTPPDRVLPTRRFDTQGLRDLDALVELRVGALHVPHLPPMEAVRLKAKLDGGQLSVKPLQFAWAGGKVNGQFALDAQRDPPDLRTELQWQKLRVEALWPDQPEDKRISGPLSGRAQFSSRGQSVADAMRHASGRAVFTLQGGSVPQRMEAKLGLHLGRLLKSLISSADAVPIHCGELIAELRDGQARSTHLVFETAQTRLAGTAVLDLRDEAFELWLDPQAKKGGALTLPQSILIRGRLGALDETKTSLEPPREMTTQGCDPARPRG